MKLIVPFLFLAWFSVGCTSSSDETNNKLVHDIPGFKELADSLNTLNVSVAKWSVNDSTIVYAKPTAVDWKKELELLNKTDVNHLRFKDTYVVKDTTIGSERSIVFSSISTDQEIRKMEIRIKSGAISYYYVEKISSSIFSDAHIKFEFRPSHYTLSLHQSVKWFFENKQFVYGSILNGGDIWLGHLKRSEKSIPISLILRADKDPVLFVKNGDELVRFGRFSKLGDTLVYGSDHFNSDLKFQFTSDSTIDGVWINNKKDAPIEMSFSAQKGVPYRFKPGKLPKHNVSGAHAAIFYNSSGEPSDTIIMELNQEKHQITGSFLTETGDYRFLEGLIRGDSLFMSTMDGTHAYLFEARIDDLHLNGTFYSGPTYKALWSSNLTSKKTLRDPELITTASDTMPLTFAFPDANGNLMSIDDKQFQNKPMVVSIIGTWCSNCLDEARFLSEVYDTYHADGLEIVALDFELVSDSVRAFNNIRRHQESLGIKYPVLLASLSSTKQKAAELLPALSGIHSYPTMVFLDKHHNIVKIHTGFNGPGTGSERYDAFRLEYLAFCKGLVDP